MTTTHITMHGEHQQWLGDNGMWRDDLAIWQREIDQVLGELQTLEDASREVRKELQDHLRAIAAEEHGLKEHEHVLAELERGAAVDELELLHLAKQHRENADRHARQRQAHERLKERHHTVMAQWSVLLKALGREI